MGSTDNSAIMTIDLKWNRFQTSRHYSVEFYSNTLLCALVNMIGTLDFQYSYRMSGEVDVANRVAYFSMKTLKKNERRPPSDG